MIEQKSLKPLIMDKQNFFQDINNWVLEEHEFGGLEYEGDECSTTYDFESFWRVGDETYHVWVEVYHRWVEHYDAGDYWTPPEYEIVHEDIEVYVNQICTEDGELIDFDTREMKKLVNSLEGKLNSLLF
jgi:hypothetical protein